jgi:hypothetical protein
MRFIDTAKILGGLFVLLTLVQAPLSAQEVRQARIVYVTVADPLNRFVNGLDKNNFEVFENRVRRPISIFSDVDSPLALAIVSDVPVSHAAELAGPGNELIQTQSLPDAVRGLAASKSARKAPVVTTNVNITQIPADIQVLQADAAAIEKTLIQLRNQYQIRFESQAPSSSVDVTIKTPSGLPTLKPSWK